MYLFLRSAVKCITFFWIQYMYTTNSKILLHTSSRSFLECGGTCFRRGRQRFLALRPSYLFPTERLRIDIDIQPFQEAEKSLAVLLPTVQIDPARVKQLHHERSVVFLHFWQGDAQWRPVRVVGSCHMAWPDRWSRALAANDGVELVGYLCHCNQYVG